MTCSIFLFYFVFVSLVTVIFSFGVSECRSLAIVCEQDVTCLDPQLFFDKCIEKHAANYIYNQRLPHKDILQLLPTNIQNNIYDQEYHHPSLQKSYAEISQPSYIIPGHGVQPEISKEFETLEKEENPDKVFSGGKNLQDIFTAYKRESLKASLHHLRDHIQKAKEFREKREYTHSNYNVRTNEKPVLGLYDGFFIENKRKELLQNSFHLIKDLIESEKKELNHRIISDSSDIVNLADLNKRLSDNNGVVVLHQHQDAELKENNLTQEKLTSKGKATEDNLKTEIIKPVERNYIDPISLYDTENREEIAVPVFSESIEEDIANKDTEHKEQSTQLILKTASSLTNEAAEKIADNLQYKLWKIKPTDHKVFHLINIDDNAATYRMITQPAWFSSTDDVKRVARTLETDNNLREELRNSTGVTIVSARSQSEGAGAVKLIDKDWDKLTLFTAVIAGCSVALIAAALFICFYKSRTKDALVGFKKQEAVQDYQELCRTQMSVANSRAEEDNEETDETMRNAWNDDPFPYNMDITTGHVILSYMEDHLKNENRLNKEWEALCNYKAEEDQTTSGAESKNTSKNRFRDVLPFNSTRVTLRETANMFHSDYINASFITDVDPRNPAYIATQGPLDNTVSDFWQMVWEQGVVVIVNLTKLSDMGLPQCHRYWPEDGSQAYHIYEVHLISEHIWCDDYLVRSLYLKNLQTAETRTITQFHYLTWPDLSVPDSPKPLLEFRRKVNKCYRGHQCPIIVHCNNGVGRTGTYILLDMVLNKMIKGAKEIDIAATLEHLRDQRPDMVKTKGQFEFALTAVAEEVTAILSSVPK